MYSLLGASPLAGRTFTREENQPGRNVAVLSHALWRRKFAIDPAVLGTAIRLERQACTVIGVMPPGFEFPHRGPAFNNEPADLFVPLAFRPEELRGWTSRYNHSVIARLKPGVTLAQAREDAGAIARRLQQEHYPAAFRGGRLFVLGAAVEPFHLHLAGPVRNLLLILQAAVGLVLLIACANVANLLLSRAAPRAREMALRTALGAGRSRLVRQTLLESLPLALAGGALGLLLAGWGMRLLVAFSPVTVPRTHEVRMDAAVLAFTLLVCCGATVMFGLAPAIQASRVRLSEALKAGGRSATGGRSHQRLLGLFVVCQIALCLVLLSAANLLLKSFARLLATDPGFRAEKVLSVSLNLPASGYQKAAAVRSFYRRLIEQAETLPGVRAVGAATDLPLAVRERRGFTIEDEQPVVAGLPKVVCQVNVLGSYFEALGIRLKRGRFLGPRDGAREPVVVINETMARRYWPGQDAVGKRIKWGIREWPSPWMTVVGVVEDVKHGPLHTEAMPQVFEPHLQVPDAWLEDATMSLLRSMTLIVRTSGEPAALAAAVEGEVRALDPQLPVFGVQTLEEHLSRSVAPQRFNALLLAVFATLALVLAAVGVYGVVAYSVSRRTHEMGVRAALGARPRDLVRMVVGQSLVLAGIGAAAGLAGALRDE